MLRHPELRLILTGLAIVAACQVVVMSVLMPMFPPLPDLASHLLAATLLSLLSAPFIWRFAIDGYREEAHRQHRAVVDREQQLLAESERRTFERALSSGMAMVESEAECLALVGIALDEVAPDAQAELSLADSSHARFRDRVRTRGEGCSVASPQECPAVRQHQVLRFSSTRGVGVCPRLRERQAGCAAICIPVSVLGRASGVLHLSAADGALPASAALQQVFHVAEQAGVRIGTLRALARIQQQADTDPLTGVLNRRAISDRVASLLTRGGAVCLGVADLDNFKRLNDVHGHATGDRALCAFTRMAVEELGEGNVGRWGGEEFLLVVPDADIDQARARLEQLRGRVFALRAPPIPVFSATIGVTSWAPGDHLEDLVRRADDALYEGKKLGRNQVRVWTHPEPEDVCLAAR